MPSNSERLPTESRTEFCLALKAARERRGLTLHEIAAATKIPAYLFAALERGDLGRWPKGLFRRSFFRDYVRMIGLPAAEACEEFVRLFPDAEVSELSRAAGRVDAVNQANDLRLALDATWHGPRASVLVRVLAALLDAAAVISVAVALARVAGTDGLATAAIVSLAYFTLATALFGESPAKCAMAGRRSILDALTHVFGGEDPGTPEPVEDPPMREWITDARRVGPSPRLRVRIKVSQ